MNVDGSCNGQYSGIGIVIRNESGAYFAGLSQSIGCCTNGLAEWWVLKKGLLLLKQLQLSKLDRRASEIRTLTSSYYRGAQGVIITVYDVTRREAFTNLSDVWAKLIDLYSTNQDCFRMLVGH
ncbi:Ras-related protein rabc1 [Thalictrum thalictroides]|uniref:Ras-related protein rabc1 n=1 Tax=Thalictrum thalictroides TaxID=46969 RepID=A0A7J6WTC1_THATH|nr:Ras-related protein rabc1 [Thalictrum thalictroides]